MDALVIKVMMQLIAGELSGIKSAVPEKELLTDELLTQLYTLARKHDLAHLIGYSLDKNGLLPVSTVSDRFREQFYASVFRYERLNSDYLNICSVLEKSKIKFIPLKSAAFRQYYPEPWMRTSCDTDILVRREELERAKQALREKADCVCLQSSMHDISFKTQNENLIELHFDLLEEGRANSSAEILKDVWDYSFKKEGSEFVYTMSNEMFLLYHIAHIAKHFESGGCGIRPIMDLWIMLCRKDFRNEKADEMLKKADLYVFANALSELADVWFAGKAPNETTLQMQDYILSSGSFGTKKNAFAINQNKKVGKLKCFLSRIFLPYEELKLQYPSLEKYRFAVLFYEIHRWVKLIFGSKAENRKKFINEMKDVTDKDIEETSALFEKIGLH